jgi:hypothetical protein
MGAGVVIFAGAAFMIVFHGSGLERFVNNSCKLSRNIRANFLGREEARKNLKLARIFTS